MAGMKFLVLLVALTTVIASPKRLQIKNRHFGIDNGNDAKPGEVPFIASVQSCLFTLCESYCGGVILNENWVLTAAECVSQSKKVVVGDSYLHENEPGKQTIDIDKILVHPDYNAAIIGRNDIALLRLKEPIKFSESVSAAKLPEQGAEFNGTADLAGYGTNFVPNYNKLQIVKDLPIISYDDCKKVLDHLLGAASDPLDEKNNICSGDLNKSANNCDGDAGSPLFQKDVVIGIATFYINPCSSEGAPNIFTKVSSFVDWINENISK